MIQSSMSYFDIMFPLSLGPLTYRCPIELTQRAKPGMLVSAPLKSKIIKGILLRKNTNPPVGTVKEIIKLHGDSPLLSRNMLRLLQWISDYYIAPEGLVLKQTVSQELFSRTRSYTTRKKTQPEMHLEATAIDDSEISSLLAALIRKEYHAFLFHAPSLIYEYSLVKKMLEATTHILIIAPEISQANLLFSLCHEQFGERICLLHGEIPKGRRSEQLGGILSGKYDTVIGTRAALFAPLKNPSLIMVLNEHSIFYKRQDAVRYHVRDVAVMRGFIEKAVVVLSSVTPSIETYFNSMTKKYELMKPFLPAQRPKIRIINMRFEKKITPHISRPVFEAAKKRLKEGRRIMFLINRRGFSTMLSCADCEHSELCSECRIPLVMHKREGCMKCHYCGASREIPGKCSRCGSHQLDLLGAGTELIQHDLEKLFRIKTVRFDSDSARKKSDIRGLLQMISSDATKIIVGTKMITRRISLTDIFSTAVVLNIDTSLNLPDFRAAETAFTEIFSLTEHVEPNGEIFIQTKLPHNHLFAYLKTGDYERFIQEEMSLRKAFRYPPYARLLKIDFSGDTVRAEEMIESIRHFDRDIEILGPTTIKKAKKGRELSIMLKSPDRKRLNTAAKKVLSLFSKTKDRDIRIDVDPL